MNMYMYESWKSIVDKKTCKKLIFIHTPKCGGTYTSHIMKDLNIYNKGHKKAVKDEGINFTIIRDPVERFESLLNYRLGEEKPRRDFPKELHYVYENTDITLNDIVSKMSDNDILGFSPYKSLTYWSENIDILITIEYLPHLLNFFGYNYNINDYRPKNVSKKVRGILNYENRERINKLYNEDVILFNNVINTLK
jgi:hypothetical protein